MKKTIIIALAFVLCGSAFAADWPQYRGDSGRSGYTAGQLPDGLSLAWKYRSPHAPLPAWKGKDTRMPFDHTYHPVIAGGRLFYGSSADCKVYALDAATGEELWTFMTDGPVRFAPSIWKNRVYVTSDDGHLYCLSASKGKLHWKKRGGPDDDMVLGNDRLISRWPARGGVVIDGDTVYFGAGIWPSEGIFIHALNAKSGKTIWVNDTAGGMVMDKPHPTARAKSGLSAHGYLAISGDILIVPTGRGAPAALDRTTGEFKYFHHQKHRAYGGSQIASFEGLMFTDSGNDRQTTTFSGTSKGIFTTGDGELLTGDGLSSTAVASYPGHIIYAQKDAVRALRLDDLTFEKQGQDNKGNRVVTHHLKDPAWTIPTPAAPGGNGLIVAGDAIISGATNNRVAVLDGQAQRVVWSAPVNGSPQGLAVADGRLYVSTDSGEIYCYDSSETRKPSAIETTPDNYPYDDNKLFADAADEILKRSNIANGYCLDLGCGDGNLAYEIAQRTNLHIIAIDPDPKNVARARKKLDGAGLYGVRVTVIEGDLDNTGLPEYFANLVVSGRSVTEGDRAVPENEAHRLQRPYGGVVCIGKPGSMKHSVRGDLEGAGKWTHQYHDPGNTITSEDELVRGKLGMLWFRDDDFDVPSRHGRGVAPLFNDGLLFVEGTDALRAVDAYNGCTVWEVPFPDIQRAYDADHLVGVAATQSNICIEGDRIYVRAGGVTTDGDYAGRSCFVLDSKTGARIAQFRTPPGPDGTENLYWGYTAVQNGTLFGSIADPHHVVRFAYRESDMNRLFSESTYFFAMDAETGDLKWSYTPEHSIRHNAIAIGDGTVYLIDRPQAVDDRNRNPHKREFAVGNHPDGKLVALDAETGRVLWKEDTDIYGTLLSLSTQHDVLIMTYQYTRFRQGSEIGGRMSAFRASDGTRLWDAVTRGKNDPRYSYSSRPIINDRMVYLEPYAWDVITGDKLDFDFSRTYACGIMAASKHMMVYRSATLGYFDLDTGTETENYGGFRPGCWINAIPAGGLVLVPDATDRCNCSYLNKATVALISR